MKEIINQVDVIDLILQKQSEEFESQEPIKGGKLITADNFFTDGNPSGFISKAGFKRLVSPQSKSELVAFDAFLKELNSGVKINAMPLEKPDTDGRNYVWVTVGYKRGTRPYKVFTAEKLSTFIGVYQEGLITCSLSLDSLYKAAIN